MEQQVYYATGRRKAAVAALRLTPGNPECLINGQDMKAYIERQLLVNHITMPLEVTGTVGKVGFKCKVKGGGKSGQAGAVRLALARALFKMDAMLRKPLKEAGFLTRDARVVERKKYGMPKARKRFQFSKR
jgi:small subunit ribosomal protein S9